MQYWRSICGCDSVPCVLREDSPRRDPGESSSNLPLLRVTQLHSRDRPEIVLQDGVAAPADLLSVLRPDPLAPVAETARLRHQQVEQGVAVGVAPRVDGPAVQHLMKFRAQLVHR